MKREGNLYTKIYDFENLYQAYLEARKGKRYRQDVLEFTANLEENLIQIQNELVHHTYKVGRYREFYVHEPKKRLIMALPFKDRVVQWAIYRILNPIFERTFISDSFACRVGRGTHQAAKQMQYWLRMINKKPGKWYFLKLDIAKYFYRVDHDVLLKVVNRKIKDEEVMRLLQTIVRSEETKFGLPIGATLDTETRLTDKGMPIGNLTSQMFANIYLNELDQYAKHKLGLRYYIRYMDDVIILHQVKYSIQQFLDERLRLNLNNKTAVRPVSLGVPFVGQQIWNTHKKMRKSTTRRMKRGLAGLSRKYSRGEVTLDKYKASLHSYLGMLKQCNSHRFRTKLLASIVLCRSPTGIENKIN